MEPITFKPIGIIHTPFTEAKGTPIQPTATGGTEATIEIFKEYTEGLTDLDGFSHIILLYYFHKIKSSSLIVTPYMDTETHGVFATRAPGRPNPIGLSIVELVRIENNILHIRNADMLDGTPLLDIKPLVHEFDKQEKIRTGWLATKSSKLQETRDDGRFIK